MAPKPPSGPTLTPAEAATLGRSLEAFLSAIGPDTLDAITAAEVVRQGKDLIDRIARKAIEERR